MSKIVKWLAGLNALLGAWLIAVPFIFEVESDIGMWNHIIVGAAILVLSGYNAMQADEDDPGSTWAAAGSSLLGLWMIVAPFLFTVGDPIVFWNDIVVGIVVAVLAAYNAYEAQDYEATAEVTAT